MAEEESSLSRKPKAPHTKSGWTNFSQQCRALFYKNFLLSRRNLRATGNFFSWSETIPVFGSLVLQTVQLSSIELQLALKIIR